MYPDNEVIIYNRWGNKVFEMAAYNNGNENRRFEGRSNVNTSINLTEGTYYYLITTESDKLTGFIFLRR